jgi:hypothetical protein
MTSPGGIRNLRAGFVHVIALSYLRANGTIWGRCAGDVVEESNLDDDSSDIEGHGTEGEER